MSATPERDLDAAALVGLLADDDRRAVFAALTLGATGLGAVASVGALPVERASKALGRLVDGGLVVSGDDGSLHVLGSAFARAARVALARPRSTEHDGEPDEIRKVLDAFVVDGRLVRVPTVRGKRLVVLDWLVQNFDPGVRYPERTVNVILGRRHPDTAALRRLLVDEEFLDRSDGEYWRAGGTVA
ncbi:MAG: DUF2087 domain-containing protein [Desertimonas sp.]